MRMVRYAAIGLEFFSPIIGGALAGYYLDRHFHTTPIIGLTGILGGTAAGLYRLIVEMRNFMRGNP